MQVRSAPWTVKLYVIIRDSGLTHSSMGKKKPKYNHETRHLRNPTFNVQFELPILPQLPQRLHVSSINHSIDSGDSRTSGQFECAVNRTLW